MCALRAHNSKPILEKVLLGIEKVVNNTRILLMCALRAHNSKPIVEKVYWELKKF